MMNKDSVSINQSINQSINDQLICCKITYGEPVRYIWSRRLKQAALGGCGVVGRERRVRRDSLVVKTPQPIGIHYSTIQ